jgi:hypothetical protein
LAGGEGQEEEERRRRGGGEGNKAEVAPGRLPFSPSLDDDGPTRCTQASLPVAVVVASYTRARAIDESRAR